MSNPENNTEPTRVRFSDIPGPWIAGFVGLTSATIGTGCLLLTRIGEDSRSVQYTVQDSSPGPAWDTGQLATDLSPTVFVATVLSVGIFAMRRLRSR